MSTKTSVKVRSNVQIILEQIPKTRDDSWGLVIEFYERYFGTVNIVELARLKAPTIETIRRASRWIQEWNLELRGKKWGERQTYAGRVRVVFGSGEFGLDGLEK